ncbi:hypothetical protein [Nocardioides sp.]|uniref:hypothetical protein n=1 Tax=Nocardioides sp. TaxID=35761 RepID=UPI0035B1D1F8
MDAKKLLLALGVVFLGFWMFNDPNGLAETAGTSADAAWGMATQLFQALIRFFGAL